MKKIASRLIIILLVMSLIVPLLPADVNSKTLSTSEMQSLVGGKEAINCDAIGAGAYMLCISMDGGWLGCTIVAAAAYLGCLAANSIAGS